MVTPAPGVLSKQQQSMGRPVFLALTDHSSDVHFTHVLCHFVFHLLRSFCGGEGISQIIKEPFQNSYCDKQHSAS